MKKKRTQNRLLISRCVFFFLAVVKIHCLNWTISKSILMLRFCCINRAVRSSALHQIENLISTIWNLSIFELHISFIYLFSASFLSRSGLFFLKRHDYMTASDMAYYSILRCALSTSQLNHYKQHAVHYQYPIRFIFILAYLSCQMCGCVVFDTKFIRIVKVFFMYVFYFFSGCCSYFFFPCHRFDRNNKWIFDVIASFDCGIRINL